MNALRPTWDRAWGALRRVRPDAALDDLVARYAEPHRTYHTAAHLVACFTTLDLVAHEAEHPPEVALALWFHDAVYDPRRTDNEARSGLLARECLAAAGVEDSVIARVEASILATRHADEVATGDARVVVDVDLSILGASAEAYDAYARGVRREYGWVDEARFRAGRSAFLRGLLGRPRIFGTRALGARLEVPARANIRRELAGLDGPVGDGAVGDGAMGGAR